MRNSNRETGGYLSSCGSSRLPTRKGGSGTGSGRRSVERGVNERSMFHKWSLTSGWMRGKPGKDRR